MAARILPAGMLFGWPRPLPLPAVQGCEPSHEPDAESGALSVASVGHEKPPVDAGGFLLAMRFDAGDA
ncbi:hypothetical protein BLAT2472_50390 [Burkholderia latens]